MMLTHPPYQPTPDSQTWDPTARGETVNRRPEHFADMVAYLDKLIGKVVGQLDALGLRTNTLVMFLGDNNTDIQEFAFTRRYKLYRDGRFFDLARDEDESTPLGRVSLTGEAAAAARSLQSALDQFRNAGP